MNFIENFVNNNGYPVPGNQPFIKLNKIRISPPSFYTKTKVFEEYKKVSIENHINYVKKRSFFRFWRRYKPDIKVMTPRADVYQICKDSSDSIMKISYNEDDNQIVNKYLKHRESAQKQRNYFNLKHF